MPSRRAIAAGPIISLECKKMSELDSVVQAAFGDNAPYAAFLFLSAVAQSHLPHVTPMNCLEGSESTQSMKSALRVVTSGRCIIVSNVQQTKRNTGATLAYAAPHQRRTNVMKTEEQ